MIAVPAPPPRKGRAAHRLHAILLDFGAAALLTEPELAPACAEVLTFADPLEDAPLTTSVHEPIALLQYTSGSTGDPKGAILSHDAVWANEKVIRTCFGHAEGARLVGWLPNYHDMGLIAALAAGDHTLSRAYERRAEFRLRALSARRGGRAA
jgi:acyl-CoA synthetase (AMP-forming)/AMP-acid ligase II